MSEQHIPVMLKQCIDMLDIHPTKTYVDATFGRGGHSKVILEQLTTGQLIVIDQDLAAIEAAHSLQKQYSNLIVVHDNYSNLRNILQELNIECVAGILVDCGVSSVQLDEGERGFSYRFDAHLDMRMNQTQKLTAYDVVNTYTPSQLLHILYTYGEEQHAKMIVRGIMKAREIKPIETTFQLVDTIKASLPNKILKQVGHPAKQTFQAIRIEVNQELKHLEEFLTQATSSLCSQGTLVTLTFHSLEDRLVKQHFKALATPPKTNKRLPSLDYTLDYSLKTSKAVIADELEIETNPRSKSAKLRAIQKL
ncbi:MAG: 16S rRNA (cytosine(1402)-N(4))-methyltransferase RsmH [Erysipelothrix sp.]|jgi:16S rRNA (cytosine1402-N4)-methyltransferase|nr:16S rRNA (cytosine(1402)-N(4))-methyltransferase RsmH [Erysipelothrix sp.]